MKIKIRAYPALAYKARPFRRFVIPAYKEAETYQFVFELMQDIGDMYAPCNHNKFAATVLHPFEGGQCTRVVEKNANLQMSYNAVHLGANPNKTEIYHGDLYLDDRPDFTKVAIRQALSVIMKAIQSNFLPIL